MTRRRDRSRWKKFCALTKTGSTPLSVAHEESKAPMPMFTFQSTCTRQTSSPLRAQGERYLAHLLQRGAFFLAM